MNRHLLLFATMVALIILGNPSHAAEPAAIASPFPRSLESYNEAHVQGILEIIIHRIQEEPFNLVATLIFFAAIIHTFMASTFMALSHKWHHEHAEKVKRGEARRYSVDFRAEMFHFLGEVEVVFGLWAVALVGAIVAFYDWSTVIAYIGHQVNFTEAAFVVVIMTLASTRPILKCVETVMMAIANRLGGSLAVLWMTIARGYHWGAHWRTDCSAPASRRWSQLLWGQKCMEVSTSRGRRFVSGIGLGRCGGAGEVSPVSRSHRAQGGFCVKPSNALVSVDRLRLAGTDGADRPGLALVRCNMTKSQMMAG